VPEHRIPAFRQDAGLDPAAGGHRRGHRHAQLDPQLSGHVDDQVADQGRPGRGDALAGQPAEQLGIGVVHGGGDAVHGDGGRDGRVVLRAARLDLRFIAHVGPFRLVRWS
jgi:hypothetical protein